MNRNLCPRIFWLVLFVVSVGTAVAIYTIQSFSTNRQVDINTKAINVTELEQQAHDKQTRYISNLTLENTRLNKLMIDILNNRTELDINLDHGIIHDLAQINDKLNILLGNISK